MKTVVVGYQTKQTDCGCCGQPLPEEKKSEIREFEITENDLEDWGDWEDIVKFDDEMHGIVDEFVHETISFFATTSDEVVTVEDNEIRKVRQFILESVKETK